MTIRPNFPLTSETMAVFALTFTGQRSAAQRLIEMQAAGARLVAVTGCDGATAHRIVTRLGAQGADGITAAVVQSGVTLEQIADAITAAKGPTS